MTTVPQTPPRASLLYNPKVRGIALQAIAGAVIGFLVYEAATNAISNLRALGLLGREFLSDTAKFDISQSLIPFSAASTYARAFLVGLLNTLLVPAVGIVLSTILGFIIGVARLSKNWIVAKLATVYVEVIRNLPLLLQLLFWYNAVLAPLPQPRDSINIVRAVLGFLLWPVEGVLGLFTETHLQDSIKDLNGGFFLNARGLFMPRPLYDERAWTIWAALGIGIVAAVGYRVWARRVQERTGQQSPVGWVTLILVLGLPLAVWVGSTAAGGSPITFEFPEQQRFNLRGGLQVFPEFVALVLGLTLYTAAFIAEVVRAGILSVSKGQTEAAHALGLRDGQTLRLIVVPQAMRVIVPPLTNQYLNLTKNSSLAVAIGYPDLVQVFMGTVLNQSGQAVPVVAMTMGVYLLISLATSALMNLYNRRVAIVER